MMRDVMRRVLAIETNQRSALMSAAIPHIPLEDGEWLLSLPLNASDTNWDLTRFTAEQTARAEGILNAAMAMASQPRTTS